MSQRSLLSVIVLTSFFSATIAAIIIFSVMKDDMPAETTSITQRQQQVSLTRFNDTSSVIVPKGLNFVNAAEKAIAGVVHIRAVYSGGTKSINPLEGFFRNPSQSSGSGVIVSDNGYIVTNNHVIEDASEIEVVLNDNRSYFGKIIGTDPTTDLALIKINVADLNFVQYGDSDNLKHGEWVLAVGNPFELNSTVTAGIVSAKARNIGILRDKNNLQIESFIQTDAAVNPGNSGGALVNLKGELIGINTAIATPTGNYTGYSFAVPVSLVKKVIDDLLEFGEVKRGLLGIRIGDVNARLAEMNNLSVVNGVFVSQVNENSAASEAGLEQGDVIIAINGLSVNNVSELQELVARNRPGDDVRVTYMRGADKNNVTATLKDFEGNAAVTQNTFANEIEGATFQNLTIEELEAYDLTYGVKITEVEEGKWQAAGIKEDFIITKIDKLSVTSIQDLNNILANKKGGILVEGQYLDGERGLFGMDW
ncbi:PDZ domain-containing protein [Fulvivirga sp. RKSG066]|uniref:trypsin-like peptidase domain-containing protein n=1 Tax=Fulvivirga aurantia TaxID=2529383 RepID=UPI0012BD2931|nr:trypsin-like peptidase domain-containing protein [Fulvivirga aurantia]MTI21441.1 PDZ domain-containing protein [Fulvivirga aurantia]